MQGNPAAAKPAVYHYLVDTRPQGTLCGDPIVPAPWYWNDPTLWCSYHGPMYVGRPIVSGEVLEVDYEKVGQAVTCPVCGIITIYQATGISPHRGPPPTGLSSIADDVTCEECLALM